MYGPMSSLKDTTGLWGWIQFSVSGRESRCLQYFHPHCNRPCRSVTTFGAADHLYVLSFLFSRCVLSVVLSDIWGACCESSVGERAAWVDLSRLRFNFCEVLPVWEVRLQSWAAFCGCLKMLFPKMAVYLFLSLHDWHVMGNISGARKPARRCRF